MKLEELLAQGGYAIGDLHVDLQIFNEVNQVILICDHKNQRELCVPVEEDVTKWPKEKLARTIIEVLDQDTMDQKGYL